MVSPDLQRGSYGISRSPEGKLWYLPREVLVSNRGSYDLSLGEDMVTKEK